MGAKVKGFETANYAYVILLENGRGVFDGVEWHLHGGALFFGNVIVSCYMHWNGVFQVVLGCKRKCCVLGECHWRFLWWYGVIGEWN